MAVNGKIVEITDSNFVQEVRDQDGLAMVDFWATWCGPCRIIAPIVEKLAEDYADKGLRVGKLDVDSNPMTASQFGVRSIPTVLFFKNGEVVDKVIGAVPRGQLEEKIKKHLAA
jgi:thioredoxin 1